MRLLPVVLATHLIASSIQSLCAQEETTREPNCGVMAVLALAQTINRGVSPEVEAKLLTGYSHPLVTMADVKNMGQTLGIDLTGVKAALDELLQAQQPAIVHLKEPDHFIVVLDGCADLIRLLPGPHTRVIVADRKEIEKRFDGYALILKDKPPPDGPRIKLPEPDFAFRVAGFGQQLEHSFEFTNGGTSPLTVTVASCRSCGSLDGASVSREGPIRPGDGAEVKVTVRVRSVGSLTETVTLKTNDPGRPVVYLTVRGTSPHNVAVTPARLSIYTQKGQAQTRVVKVLGPPGFKAEVPLDTADAVQVSGLDKVDSDAKVEYTLQVRVSSGSPVGDSKATITVKTNHTERPTITIPVQVHVEGELVVEPRSAFFGFLKPGEKAEKTVVLRSRGDTATRIVSVQCKDGRVKAGAPKSEGNQHAIAITLDTSKPGFIDTVLLVETDVEGEEGLEIPVTALVQ